MEAKLKIRSVKNGGSQIFINDVEVENATFLGFEMSTSSPLPTVLLRLIVLEVDIEADVELVTKTVRL